MPYLHNYRLFISHAWKYSDGYERVKKFLDAAPNFIHTDYSVPESKAFGGMTNNQLAEQLKSQIRPVQTVIIVSGMYVAHSGWIQHEIDFAKSLYKPILGIRPWGAEVMPQAVTNAANEIVNWNTASIVAAIRRITP